jgi:Restriction endonuclease S subunits
MTPEILFEKFGLFADAPDAVERMRELTYQLAVQGKLVPQDPTEESAAILLERIHKARADLLGNRRSRGEAIATELDGDVLPHAAPAGWVWTSLGNVQVFTNGYAFKSDDYQPSGVGIIRMSELGANGEIDETNMKYVLDDIAQSLPNMFRVRPGDLLMGMSGSIGKLAINRSNKTYLLNQRVGRLEPILIEKAFLQVFLKTVEQHYLRISFGMAIKNLSTKQINETPFPLPPLVEQKRIVAKVHQLMALCDRLEAQQQECKTRRAVLARSSLARFTEAPTPGNLNLLFHKSYTIPPADLRKSILTLAVRGKLVPQDPNDEPAARVLERIDSAPKRAMRTRATDGEECDVPSELEPLFELPAGWEWALFRRLPLQASVGIDRGRSMQGPDKAFGYFKMNNIRNSGGVDLSELTRINATPNEVEAFALADGDFLFNTRNSRELVGKTCVFRPSSDDPVLYNNNILRVKLIVGFSADFLDYWFRSPQGSAELEKLKSNTTNVCAIYQGKLSGFPCPVPPLAEQGRIVAKVDQLMALVDHLETQLAASRTTAAKLTEAMVSELAAAA